MWHVIIFTISLCPKNTKERWFLFVSFSSTTTLFSIPQIAKDVYVMMMTMICVIFLKIVSASFGLLADNIWVDSEATDELWSRWMDWESKERVRSCDWRILHPPLSSLLPHLPQSHQGMHFNFLISYSFFEQYYNTIKNYQDF